MRRSVLCIAALVALPASAQRPPPPPSCSTDGYARRHGSYPAGRGACTLNADNYYKTYLDALKDNPGVNFNSTATRYSNIVADFAGTGAEGNLKKLTADRIGACPNAGGLCGSSFWEGSDPTPFPDNETDSWAHVALYNPQNDNGKLLVVLPGSPGHAKNFIEIGLRAALAGYRVILLQHLVYGATACVNEWPDSTWSFEKATNHSPSVDQCITQVINYLADGVPMTSPYAGKFNDRLNEKADDGLILTRSSNKDSVHNRLRLLLYWLNANFPTQGWGNFLTCQGTLCTYTVQWDKVALAAHSMGTQPLTWFAHQFLLDRAIYIAGPHPRLGEETAGLEYQASFFSRANVTKGDRMYALLQTGDNNYLNQIFNHSEGDGLISDPSYDNKVFPDWGMAFSDDARLIVGTATPAPSDCGSNPYHKWVAGTCGSNEYQSSWDWMLNNHPTIRIP